MSATGADRMPSGTYWWNVRWETFDPFVEHFTPAASFTIPTYIRAPKLVLTQYATVNAVYLAVSCDTNAPTASVKCFVYQGTKIVARGAVAALPPLTGRTTGYCNLKIAESLDGKKLRAYAQITGGGTVAKVSKIFVAK